MEAPAAWGSLMADPVCIDGGWIVGIGRGVPADPREYFSLDGPVVGCNRIKCRSCGAWVRPFDECSYIGMNLSLSQYPKVYESKNPFEFDFMVRDEDSRVYICRCAIDKTSGGRSLGSLDLPNWYCAGHPQG